MFSKEIANLRVVLAKTVEEANRPNNCIKDFSDAICSITEQIRRLVEAQWHHERSMDAGIASFLATESQPSISIGDIKIKVTDAKDASKLAKDIISEIRKAQRRATTRL